MSAAELAQRYEELYAKQKIMEVDIQRLQTIIKEKKIKIPILARLRAFASSKKKLIATAISMFIAGGSLSKVLLYLMQNDLINDFLEYFVFNEALIFTVLSTAL